MIGICLKHSSFLFFFKIDFRGCVYTVHGVGLQNVFMPVYNVYCSVFSLYLTFFFLPSFC